jgi:hypothetical protein
MASLERLSEGYRSLRRSVEGAVGALTGGEDKTMSPPAGPMDAWADRPPRSSLVVEAAAVVVIGEEDEAVDALPDLPGSLASTPTPFLRLPAPPPPPRFLADPPARLFDGFTRASAVRWQHGRRRLHRLPTPPRRRRWEEGRQEEEE